MKNRVVISLLCLMFAAGMVACGTGTGTSSSENNVTTQEVTEENSSSEATTSAIYEELTIKTDWDLKAEITFSDSGMTIDGSGCTDQDGVLYITEGGAYTLTGSSTNASILINTEENVKLILNGVDLTSEVGPVIYGDQVKNLYIELAEGTTNTLADSDSYETDSSTGEEIGKAVISCNDDIIILGEGTLNITGNHNHVIASDDKLYIEAGTINVTSNVKDGIKANDLVCIDGGTVNVTSSNEGIESENTLVINGGDITVNAVDDGINAGYYLEINGGTVTVTSSENDAIDCNGGYDGCITINDGEVNATGAGVPEGALDADTYSVIINGGKVTATGGANSPIIENGGENNITGETFTGGPGGGQGGPGGNGDFDPNNLPEDFDPGNMPEPPEGFESGERPEMPENADGQMPQKGQKSDTN
ncbi:MAG: carbohydrate-binding domain-containing protein [Pseudobutyrivibrio sp.]|nr:carbohydrate-binding domain-containing protein [Pseudobutyrivibrio sp.]